MVGASGLAGNVEFLRASAALRRLAGEGKAVMDSVTTNTIAIIAERLPAEKRDLQVSGRLDDLGIDSFTAIEMIFDLEEKFDIQILYNSNDVRPGFQTVGDVVDAIKKLAGGNS
jgi:acyl carrier protein